MEEFETARTRGLARLHERQGIGTLGERSLHVILKYWIDADESHHEIVLKLGRIVADVFDGTRVFEIQTRNFGVLNQKLERILPHHPVTIVYPITRLKRLIWVDPETGESTKPRRSPKTGQVWDAFRELYRIRKYLTDDRLIIRLVMLDIDEFRLKDGWANEGKRGSHRLERIPVVLGETLELQTPEDYAALLPDTLEQPFTSTDLAAKVRLSRVRAGEICNVLYIVGAIIRAGKRGNSYLYQKQV